MTRTSPLWLLALLVTSTMAPGVSANHQIEESPQPPGAHQEDPVDDTGFIAVDEEENHAYDQYADAERGALETYNETFGDASFVVDAFGGRQPVTFFADGIATDPHAPRYTEWDVIGADAWTPSKKAARAGEWGYATSAAPDGRYAGLTRSLLVTPELDLRTQFIEEESPLLQGLRDSLFGSVPDNIKPVTEPIDKLLPPLVSFSATYAALFGDQGLLTDTANDPIGGGQGQGLLPTGSDTLDEELQELGLPAASGPTDLFYQLQFDSRYNLANGRDGVQYRIYTEPPGPGDDLTRCEVTCFVLTIPDEGYRTDEVDALPGVTTGFDTGFADWDRRFLDVTPWLTESVWVGFYFVTAPVPSRQYFASPELFDQEAGFFGFQLDNLRLVGPAAPLNLHVRAPHEPHGIPAGRTRPTLPVGHEATLAAYIQNTGSREFSAQLNVRLEYTANATTIETRTLDPFTLRPGRVHLVDESFGVLPEGRYRFILSGVADDPLLDEPQRDNVGKVDFDVGDVHHVSLSDAARSAASVRVGETAQFSALVTNDGNLPESFVVTGHAVERATGLFADDLLPPAQLARPVSLMPGESVPITWDLAASRVGQFAIFASLGVAPGFDPNFDLGEMSVERMNAGWLAPGKSVEVDGVIDLGAEAWADAPEHRVALMEVSDALSANHRVVSRYGTMRVLNDAEALFLAITLDSAAMLPQCGEPRFYLHDLDEDLAGVRHALPFAGESAMTLPAGCGDIGLPAVFELRQPLGPTALDAAPGDLVAFAFEVFHNDRVGIFPAGASAHDGFRVPISGLPGEHRWYGIAEPDGDLVDEVEAWGRLLLAQPLAGDVVPVGARILSPWVGVDRNPPHFLSWDAAEDGCNLEGWTQTGLQWEEGDGYNHVDKWNCGRYAPEDRELLFLGVGPDEDACLVEDCTPYNRLAQMNGDLADRSMAVSPPFTISADSTQPYLWVNHQFSTRVDFGDTQYEIPTNVCNNQISVNSVAFVTIQVWNTERQVWEYQHEDMGLAEGPQELRLQPEGGYSSESGIGVLPPALEACPGRLPVDVSTCMLPDDPTARREDLPHCGWWWPTGYQPRYRPPDEEVETGALFQGSPWRLDRVPLFGEHFIVRHDPDPDPNINPETYNPESISLAGKTVRLVFNFVRAQPHDQERFDRPDLPREDPGWRIGAIAVTEGASFFRDVNLTDLRIDTLRDPLALVDGEPMGVGPGTLAPIEVTVRNEGLATIGRFEVFVEGTDPLSATHVVVCQDDLDVLLPIQPGESRALELGCLVPDTPGSLIQVRAGVNLPDGEDFEANNERRLPEPLLVRSSPNVGVASTASPAQASEDFVRTLSIELQNSGNVVLDEFEVFRTIVVAAGSDMGTIVGAPDHWTVHGALPPGERRAIDDALFTTDPPYVKALDGLFDPPHQGRFLQIIEVRAVDAPEADLGDNFAFNAFDASTVLLADDFDAPAQRDPRVVSGDWDAGGTTDVWSVTDEAGASTRRLLAGNTSTDELPAQTDAWFTLPALDLTTARSAALTFRTRYDIERSFDAGRIEISLDGGQTWKPLSPVAQPLLGRPGGYPEGVLVGSNAFLTEAVTLESAAFSGRSSDQVDADAEGWIPFEVDLADVPEMARPINMEFFGMADLAERPDGPAVPIGDAARGFRAPSWVLDEPAAEARGRFWWIQNLTLDEPRPHSGFRHGWSGTIPVGAEAPVLDSSLFYSFVPDLLGRGSPTQPELVRLEWWEWRAGWQDDHARTGTGADYVAGIAFIDTDSDGLRDVDELNLFHTAANDADTDNDGWADGAEVHMGSNPLDGLSEPVDADLDQLADAWELRFWPNLQSTGDLEADTDDQDGLPHGEEQEYGTNPRDPDTDDDGIADGPEVDAPYDTNPAFADILETRHQEADGWSLRSIDVTALAGQSLEVMFHHVASQQSSSKPLTSNNRGWFIDDLSLVSYVQVSGAQGPTLQAPIVESSIDFEDDAENPPMGSAFRLVTLAGSVAAWSVVEQGAGAHDGGWHVDPAVEHPATGSRGVWTIAQGNDQGYPHSMDARLVSPVVDLASTPSNGLQLVFDHRYDLEAARLSTQPHGYDRARDGGIVEYQILNEATGEFGPWRTLEPEAPTTLYFTFNDCDEGVPRTVSRSLGDSDAALDAATYPGVYDRGLDDEGRRLGRGAPFEDRDSLRRCQRQAGNEGAPGTLGWYETAWRAFPVSYVFTGDSHGWRHEDWDISSLAGSQVRFAFRAWSDPSFAGIDPLLGWQVTNVGVVGQAFAGAPVLLRFRLATDDSVTKGEWSIDDVALVGDLFDENIAIRADESQIEAAPGSAVSLGGEFVNLGRDPRAGLALVLTATRADTGAPVGIEIDAPTLEQIDADALPDGVEEAWGPFALASGGHAGDSIPFAFSLELPEATTAVDVFARLLEDSGSGGAQYDEPVNQVPGNLRHLWRILGEDRTDVVPVPGPSGGALVTAQPAFSQPGDVVTLTGRLKNNGTTEPDIEGHWVIEILDRKGPESLGGASREKATVSDPVGVLGRGESSETTATFVPDEAGLYRATLTAVDEDDQVVGPSASIEFVANMSLQYYVVDFAQAQGMAGWTDGSPEALPGFARFHRSASALTWGVTQAEFQQGRTYCHDAEEDICNTVMTTNSGDESQAVVGPEGIAVSPPIDLGRVPQGKATLTMLHSFNFEEGDGGRVEAIPYRTPIDPDVGPEPLFVYPAEEGAEPEPVAFVLQPSKPADGRAQSLPFKVLIPGSFQTPPSFLPARINPLHPNPQSDAPPVYRGPQELEVSQFELDQIVQPIRPHDEVPEDFSLMDHTFALRLHVGIRPEAGGKQGALGWQIRRIAVSSTGAEIAPETFDAPMAKGIPKEFGLLVSNTGQAQDTLTLAIDAASSNADDAWFAFPQPSIDLDPGETRRVPVRIHVPADPTIAGGAYEARVRAVSSLDPNFLATSLVRVLVQDNPLPDLTVAVVADTVGDIPLGTVEPVHVTVTNVGSLDSKPVTVRLVATRLPEGAETVVGEESLVALCPFDTCGRQASRRTLTFEWGVPIVPGPYRLAAEVDPDERLTEPRRDNNVDHLDVQVVPPNQPDLEVRELRILGVGPTGQVEAGRLLEITANVTNRGLSEARGVEVRLLAGSAELKLETIEVLPAGHWREVTGFKVAGGDEVVFRAVALLTGGTESRIDNNELRRLVRIVSHELELATPDSTLDLPPDATLHFPLTVRNQGNTPTRVALGLVDAPDGWGLSVTPNPITVPARGGEIVVQATLTAAEQALARTIPIRISAAPAGSPNRTTILELQIQVPVVTDPPIATVGNATAAPGPVVVPIEITSRSNELQTYVARLFTPTWTSTPASVPVAPGETQSANVSFTVPPTTPTGNHTLTFVLLDAASRVAATVNGTINVLPRINGTAGWGVLRAITTGLGESRFQYELHIANTGNVPFTAQIDGPLVGPDATADAPSTAVVQPGETRILPLVIDQNSNASMAPDSLVDVWAVAAGETDVDRRHLATLALPQPQTGADLTVRRIDATPAKPPAVGEPIHVTFVVENVGRLPTPATRIYAFVDGELVAAPIVPGLPAGGQHRVQVEWTGRAEGRHLLVAHVDPEATVFESNEDNNAASHVLEFEPAAGLVERTIPAPLPVATLLILGLVVALRARRRTGGSR